MTIQHILIPLDFSLYSEHALEYAITLGTQLQARLTLLHVIQPPLIAGADAGVWPSMTFMEEIEAAVRRDLEGCLARVTSAGLKGEMVVVHGLPFQTIIDTASARQVDLIIMGTHGRTGLTHLLLGSVAERVVRLAPCPVLVARLPTPAPSDA